MTGIPIITPLVHWCKSWLCHKRLPPQRDLHTLWLEREHLAAQFQSTPTVLRILGLLGPLHWAEFPNRNLERNWGQPTISYAAVAAVGLLQLNEQLVSMRKVREYLCEHPVLIWLLGFPLVADPTQPWGIDPEASLPTARHLTHLYRTLPNAALQYLLADSVAVILAELRARQVEHVGECVSLDTKHILAWVKENNPKAYVKKRYDKTQPPTGDPDCRLGCKRRRNQGTPTTNPLPASQLSRGEFYWGYGSGVVVVKVPEWGEFVVAELTQPFDCGDLSYFFPLLAQTEARLGFRPRWGTFDAAFDAFYVYEYFYRPDDPQAFAAVPFSAKGGYQVGARQFSPAGWPLCKAGLAMPPKVTFVDRASTLVEHERARYGCPLRGTPTAGCPVADPRWGKGGCVITMATSVGARIRYQLDRESESYKRIYNQRSATERINSQAVYFGIERPRLRNQQAITNRNTLIYLLINLRFIQRLREQPPVSS